MKYYILMLVLVISIGASSQKSYPEILNMTKEVKVIDRLYLDISNLDRTKLDEATALKFFKKLFGTSSLPKDFTYYISGKITKSPDFDILILYTEKNTTDTLKNFNLLLLTMRKDGTVISTINCASDHYYFRNNKPLLNKTRSYLYSDFKIKQENEISTMNKKYEAEYRINDYGVFVFYPDYSKN